MKHGLRKLRRGNRARSHQIEALESRQLLAVVINEFLADNHAGIVDEDNDHSDWIELHNTGTAAVNLAGWYLTDDSANLTKWQFPTTSLAANGYQLVFASSKNRAVAGSPLHTNFELSSDGEYLALVMPDGTTVASSYAPFPSQLQDVSYGVASSSITTDALIDEEAPLRVLVPTNNSVDTTWRSTTFNDSSWLAGTSGVGYDNSTGADDSFLPYIDTNVGGLMRTSTGGSSGYAAYVRVPFQVADKDQLTALTLRMRYDDGFVAYINGTEVARRNATGTPAFNSSANAARNNQSAQLFEDIDITSFLPSLNNGTNVLAIAGLNRSSSSSELNDFLLYPVLNATRTAAQISGFMATPTPGAANVVASLGFVADTKFSVDRGVYTSPISLSITTATTSAQIRYTLDGSEPTATTGFVFDANNPIVINHTTTLRASAFKAGYTPSDIDTQTYLFPTDIIQQSATGLAPSANWGHLGPDWAMDPNIVNTSHDDVVAGLSSIPSMSLVMPWQQWFGPSGKGIYIYGSSIEEGTSLEYFNADGSNDFQQNASVQIQGGSSDDRWKDDKLSLRLKFKAPYGPTKLDFPLFSNAQLDQTATHSFDTLILDGVLNNSWVEPDVGQNQHAMFIQDQVVADLQNLAGGHAPHGTYVNLYLNGLYWGVYYAHERPDASFASSYLGGDKDDYDVLKHNSTTVVDGDSTAAANYATLLSAVRQSMTSATNYQNVANMLDVKDFADYMIVNYYAGNTDWDIHNWYASYDRASGTGKWRFHSWDAEHVFENLSTNQLSVNTTGGPTEIQQRLMVNSEYRLLFADEVQRLMFNGGALTPQSVYSVYTTRMNQVSKAMFDESARWGDNQKNLTNPSVTYTQANWQTYNGDPTLAYGSTSQHGLLANYFPQRTAAVIQQLVSKGWLPSVDAALYNQFGGHVNLGFQLMLSKTNATAANAVIYYTLNGTDPRVSGTGAISSSAQVYSSAIAIGASEHVKARVRDASGNWSALTDAVFFLPDLFPARITELNYHPADHVGIADSDDLEFIELMNTSSQSINLQGVSITVAIDTYTFASTPLAPGERIVVARKPTTFGNVYGNTIRRASTGYSGKLDNAGEHIILLGPLGETLQDFTYDDEGAWPTAADGNGSSLEIVDPLGDPSDPANWRASFFAGGSPDLDGIPLHATNAQLQPAALSSISMTLSKSISLISLQSNDLILTPAAGGSSILSTGATWDEATRTLTFTLPSLADGNYVATLPLGSISAADGNAMGEALNFNFFIFAGDANHDRVVDADDLYLLATHWFQTGATFAQGDFNGDGLVDGRDLGILSVRWQQRLPDVPPPPPPPALATSVARRAPARAPARTAASELLE